MSKRQAAWSEAMRRGGRGPGLGGAALALLVLTWTGAPGASRADTIVLKSGEVLEGSIIDATRNTVIVEPAIGGMRQMSLRDIAEVRIDLARGQSISGQLLSWADGIYQVRTGGQVVRVSEGDVLSREPGETAGGEPQRDSPRPAEPQTVRRAAALPTAAPEEPAAARPGAARQQAVARGPEGENQQPRAGEARSRATDEDQGRDQRPAAGQDQTQAVDEPQSPRADENQTLAEDGDQRPAAGQDQSQADEPPNPAGGENQTVAGGDKQTPPAGQDRSQAVDGPQSPAADEGQTLAAGGAEGPPGAEKQSRAAGGEDQSRATQEEQTLAAVPEDQDPAPGEERSLAVNASVDPAEPGAESMVFKIELSRPAEQTIVLIYGTVEGTAKAGEDFEPRQGMVTLAPGTKSAEVRVPLIEQPSSEGEKRFELFLAADPKVAEVVDKRIAATINGGS